MRNGLQKYLLVFLTVGLCALPAFGQGWTGSLSGTVTDPKGAGATVNVKSAATGQEFSTQANNNGAYSIPTLSSGVYTATIVAAGLKQAAVTDIEIDVGKASTINVELEIGSANETVTVVGGGELRQTQSAMASTTLTNHPSTACPKALSTSHSTESTCMTTSSNRVMVSSRTSDPEPTQPVRSLSPLRLQALKARRKVL